MATHPSASWTPGLLARLPALTRDAGFDLSGVAPALPSPDRAVQTAARLEAFLDAGHAGEMHYLARRDDTGTLLRSAVAVALPWARSVIVCALNYNAAAPRSIDPAPPNTGWIARYAWSGKQKPGNQTQGREAPEPEDFNPSDYHDDLLARLRSLEATLQTLTPCQTRCYVDTGPLLERDLAARAGIGWTGKNTCILNQQLGSWLLLAVIATSLDLPETSIPLPPPDRCGSCTRCLDACPTDALIAPRQMDASLCISYLTIEKKGSIPEPLRPLLGRHVFGCDICQDVCPWNRKAPITTIPIRTHLINPELALLASLDPPTFNHHFKKSPLERTGRKRLLRNVAIAMGNTADPTHLPQLQIWSAAEDPVLAEAATWAIATIHQHASPPNASASIDTVQAP